MAAASPDPPSEVQEETNAIDTPRPRTINVCIDRASAASSFWCCAGPDAEDPSDMAVITGTDEFIVSLLILLKDVILIPP